MNPILQFYEKEVQKFKYKDYVIDEYKHQILFDVLYKLIHAANKNNLPCYLTGSISILFQFKKIYRTMKDIDLVIKKEDFVKWAKIIRSIDTGYYLFFYEDTSKEAIENWNNSKILVEKRSISFKHLYMPSIDFINTTEKYQIKMMKSIQIPPTIELDGITIDYIPSIKYTDVIHFHRPIDQEDIEFLLQFEDSREFLLQFQKNKDIYRNMAKW